MANFALENLRQLATIVVRISTRCVGARFLLGLNLVNQLDVTLHIVLFSVVKISVTNEI